MKSYNLVVRDDNGNLIWADSWGIIAEVHDAKTESEAMKQLADRLKREARAKDRNRD